jgi:hypothetical protein
MNGNVPSAEFTAFDNRSVKDRNYADQNVDAMLSFTDKRESTLLDSITG